jgi:UDP-glucose 4-epimerase
MATAWITGAHGFIGRHLAKRLADAGDTVAGIGNGAWPGAEASMWGVSDWVEAEVCGAGLDRLAAAGGAPDSIYHLAGGSSVGRSLAAPLEDFRRTADSTAALLEWARLNAPSAAIVAVSSAAVYGNGHAGPIDEDAALRPVSPYGSHKVVMEELCRSFAQNFGLRIAIVRPFSVYGRELSKQLLWELCLKLERDEPVTLGGSGEELRDWLHVDDVARLLRVAASRASEEVALANGGRGEGVTVRAIAEMARSAWGDGPKVSFDGQRRLGDPFSLVAGRKRLDDWGFDWHVTPETGIADYVRWFRSRTGAGA